MQVDPDVMEMSLEIIGRATSAEQSAAWAHAEGIGATPEAYSAARAHLIQIVLRREAAEAQFRELQDARELLAKCLEGPRSSEMSGGFANRIRSGEFPRIDAFLVEHVISGKAREIASKGDYWVADHNWQPEIGDILALVRDSASRWQITRVSSHPSGQLVHMQDVIDTDDVAHDSFVIARSVVPFTAAVAAGYRPVERPSAN